MWAMAAQAVIKTGTAIGQAVIEGNATEGAIGHQMEALRRLQYYDVEKLNDTAQRFDREHFSESLRAQREDDPLFGQMRDQGARNINALLAQDLGGETASDRAMRNMETDAETVRTQNNPLIQGLIDQAKADLAAGATLGPEFQSELVRSGLEKAGASGLELGGAGATGSNIRRLLGSEGIALQQSRAREAQSLAGTAAGLQSQRHEILSDLATMDNNLRGARMQRAAGAAGMATSMVPSIGMGGADAVNLENANTQQRNQVTLAEGYLNGLKDISRGAMWSKILGSGSEAIGSMLGGMGGGAAGGAGGGAGGMLGGLMGGGGGGAAGGAAASAAANTNGWAQVGSWIGGLLNRRSGPAYNPNLSADDNRANNALFGLGAR